MPALGLSDSKIQNVTENSTDRRTNSVQNAQRGRVFRASSEPAFGDNDRVPGFQERTRRYNSLSGTSFAYPG